jgi:asparagine synthase (glutamine-hydrolysing)
MCGICGVVNFKPNVNKTLVRKMSKTLVHRGPDDEGYFFDKNAGLGNRRLSIIDIKAGHQPIHNEDETVWITFNGEIYNFQELREILGIKHKFYTNSDTEVIVHAYEEWGEECVKRFNGMWAFALWDSKKKRLFLSRDRFGEKPLYYHSRNKEIVFASEAKALLQDKAIGRVPNDKIIYDYLLYGQHDHSDETFFEGIKVLPPAHIMIFDEQGVKIKRYWDLKINKRLEFSSKNDEEYAKKFYELLEDAVKMRLVSEVPLGVCLSGGLDSSTIVSIIDDLLIRGGVKRDSIGKRLKTFSAVFDDKKIDERRYIEEVIRNFNVEKNYIFPDSKSLWKDVRKLVYYHDEPFGGTSIHAQWEVMKIVKKKVTVVLDGQGGDELLAGYIPYYGIFFFDLWKNRKIPQLMKEFILSLDLTSSFIRRYVKEPRREGEIKNMLKQDFVSKHDRTAKPKWKGDDFAEFLYQDIVRNSLPRLLRNEDRISMAFSIETRVPFLDHRLVEYVFSLPVNQRIKNGWTKFILRNAMKGVLPEKIRKRRSKIGFATPEVQWFMELKDKIRGVLSSKRFGNRKYFNQEEVLRLFDEFCEGKLDDDYTRVFWRILNLEIWFEVFFDEV